MNKRPPIWTPNFLILSIATVCFFLSFNILLPVLPKYVISLGGNATQVGIVFGSMSLAAIVFRPFAGRGVDRRSSKLFVLIGIGTSALASFLYPLAGGLGALILVRILHAGAIANFYPGASTLTAAITPAERRAEALSYFSMFLYVGFAAGPALGEQLIKTGGFTTAFVFSGFLALVGLAVTAFLREPRKIPREGGSQAPLLHRAAVFPAGVLALAAISFAAIGVFIPLYIEELGSGDSRFFFVAMSITIIVMRFFVGKVADRFGRASVIIPGTTACALAMFTIATSAAQPVILAGAVIFGLGWGALFPGLLALVIDRVPEHERGSATGTFTAAFDVAFGSSTILLGAIVDLTSFRGLYLAAGVAAVGATSFFLLGRRRSEAAFPAMAE